MIVRAEIGSVRGLATLTGRADVQIALTESRTGDTVTDSIVLASEAARAEMAERFPPPACDDVLEVLDSLAVQMATANCSLVEKRPLVIRRAVNVTERRANYLWRPWLPFGSYVDLGGDPGVGKTTVAVELAARTTTGHWPDGEFSEPRHTVFLATEDSIDLVLKPRLRAAGADMERVTFIEGTTAADGGLDDLMLDRDYEGVLSHIRETRAGLVYIDALVDVLPAHDGNGYVESRQATKLLPKLARDSEAVVVATRHMKKAGDGTAWKQSLGSVGYASRARVMIQIYLDRNDEGRRILTCAKHNTAAFPPSLAFRLQGGDEDTPPRVQWIGEDRRSANDLAAEAAKIDRPATELDRAENWLADRLALGAVDTKALFAEADAAEISRTTLYNAAKALKVCMTLTTPRGFGTGRSSVWQLPAHTSKGDEPVSPMGGKINNLAGASPTDPGLDVCMIAGCQSCGNRDAIADEAGGDACPKRDPVAYARPVKARAGRTAK